MSERTTRQWQVSLPMYPLQRPAVQALWEALARQLPAKGMGDVPTHLLWPENLPAHWQDTQLLLSQACGYPLMTLLKNRVQLVGTFHYDAPGCDGVLNRSQVVARSDDAAQNLEDLRGRRVAINSLDSQSGFNSLRALLAPLGSREPFFASCLVTGGHLQSVLAVRDGVADVASIDCVSLEAMRRHCPEATKGIRVLGQSAPYPGLPLITSNETSAQTLQALRQALQEVCMAADMAQTKELLCIRSFEALDISAYQVCLEMEAAAQDAGFRLVR